ncbi:hypothetical protein FJY90_06295 [Candidatus Gottesmanbacteria bacterium]|nr:hypothetical protein [Candidatus Gottesmanbacteria bacterium]
MTAENVFPARDRAPVASAALTHQPLPASGDIFRGDISSMGSFTDVVARGDAQCSDCACGLVY